jgi:hypothetical protein
VGTGVPGKIIAKGYSNWFGVNLLCAITELELLAYKLKDSYKKQLNQSLITRQKHKERRSLKKNRKYTMKMISFIILKDIRLVDFLMELREQKCKK